MTTFEIIILIIYYLFAWPYMYLRFLNVEENVEENKGLGTFLFTMFAASTIGIVMFPMVFAVDIWEKLNS